jgi:hypothetical protein
MIPYRRYRFTALAVLLAAGALVLLQGRPDRPAPRLPAGAGSTMRPTALPREGPSAREILDRGDTLGLSRTQVARLKALDRQWSREADALRATIHDAEQEFAEFAKRAQAAKGASVQDILRQSADYASLSGELRVRRRQHSAAALGLLTEGQRARVDHDKTGDPGGTR